MKASTRDEIQQILRRVVCCEIPVKWRANNATPGAGERRSHFRGSNGHEFESLDEYSAGDDPRDIDWKATAQTGGRVIYKQVYEEETELKVFILVDVSRSMDFGTMRATKRFLAAELAASICRSAGETADRVGFIAYSESRIEKRIPTASAKRALLPVLAGTLETASSKNGKTGSGLVKALSALPRKRSLVFVLSDFHDLSQEEKACLRRASLGQKHDVICLVIEDRREREMPPGCLFYTFEDMESGERVIVCNSAKNREKLRQDAERRRRELLSFLKKEVHADALIVSTEEGEAAIPKVMQLFAGHNK